MATTGQKLKKDFKDMREIANVYFSMLSSFNGFKLTELEINLLAHIAINGHIGSVTSKGEFIDLYKTTKYTLNNIISKLYKKRLLVKTDHKIRINPGIKLDFQQETDKFIFVFTCLYQKESKTLLTP